MASYRKRYLRLSSILCVVLFGSCHLSKYHHSTVLQNELLTESTVIPVFTKAGESKKFKATIDVLNKHFSGLVIIKQTDALTKHIVFITELGMTMFDFELKDSSIQAVYVFEPMNKPKLVSALKTNFKNMLLADIYNKPVESFLLKHKDLVFILMDDQNKRFFITNKDKSLRRQETFHKRKRLSKIDYLYLNAETTYTNIKSVQYGIIKIRIELNQISD